MENFINQQDFVVNEQFALVKNSYEVLDLNGTKIGMIKEQRSFLHVLCSMIFGKPAMPFHIELLDANDNVIATVERGFTLWRSVVHIYDENHQHVGYLRQKMLTFRPVFRLYNTQDQEIATLKGSFLAWDFSIANEKGEELGAINKKWAGLVTELFTTKDRYKVHINPAVTDKSLRTMIASAACVIDMLFKEN